MNENIKNYLKLLKDLDLNVGKRTERFFLLSLLFFLPSIIYVVLILIHSHIVGIKDEDSALMNFYLPLACLKSLLSVFVTSLIYTSTYIHSFWLMLPLFYILPVVILYDCSVAVTKDEVITKALIVLPKHILKSRQSVL